MKVRNYETELLEIEKAYNDEQALIKQCTEKLFEDMKEPMDFFIRKEFYDEESYVNLYDAYNFAINKVTNFDCVSICPLTYRDVSSLETKDYLIWCKKNHVNEEVLKNLIFDFVSKKHKIYLPSSYLRKYDKLESKIFKLGLNT